MSDIIKITDNQNEVVDIINGKMQVESKISDEILNDIANTQTNLEQKTIPFDIPFNSGLQFTTGLFLTVTAANCNALVLYE